MAAVGSVLERKYRVIRQIGVGGMGAVFEAEHVLIGKLVAVKTLHPEFAVNADTVRRFHREAQAASRIRHVNVIEISDMGVAESGEPYLVMELLDGESLAAVLHREGALPCRRAVDIMGQALGALVAAHAQGIVHRDLKPENIFLVNHGGRADFVKVLDFGISKMRTGDGELGATRTGMMLGTPYYMAPEQAIGRTDLDHRADIYASGTVLYEVLAGHTPYQGANYNELIAKIITTDPVPIRSLRPDVAPGLAGIVARAMHRDPKQRFPTAAEMLEALIPFGASRTPFEKASGICATVAAPEAVPVAAKPPRPAEGAGSTAEPPGNHATLAPASSPTSTVIEDVRPGRRGLRIAALAGLAAALAVGAVLLLTVGRGGSGSEGGTGSSASLPDAEPGPRRPETPAASGTDGAAAPEPPATDPTETVKLPPDAGAEAPATPPAPEPAGDAEAAASATADGGPTTGDADAPGIRRRDADRRPRDAGGRTASETIGGRGGTSIRTTYQED